MKHIAWSYKDGVNHNDVIYLTCEMWLVFSFAVWYIKTVIKENPIVTSMKSDREYCYSDVHAWGRGVDMRVHHLGEKKYELEKEINKRFRYGRNFKCALIHGDALEKHLHLQVPFKTDINFMKV